MTRKEFSHLLIELIGLMAEMNYSQVTVESVLGMILPLTTQNKEIAVIQFIELAKKKLPQTDYHYEISQIFKELMGYE